MAKFSGRIGFERTMETSPSVYKPTLTWRYYKGDVAKNSYRWQRSENVNDNLNINNHISIVADSFAIENVGCIKCVELNKSKWKVVEAILEYPRITLYLGDLYNG